MTQEQTSKQQRFCALLEPNHDRLARFARAMTKSSEDARDLVSDTIEQAYKHFDELKSDTAFLSWLFTIARRIQNRRRWRMSIFDRFSPDEHETLSAEHSQTSPETHVDTQILYDALQSLPHKQREAFVLFEISGFSLQEIQELQGDSLSAVKMRLVRAREALRTMLSSHYDTDRSDEDSEDESEEEVYEKSPPKRAKILHLTNPSPPPNASQRMRNKG